ncbi:putative D-xylose utilization operon transcriptional repressor [subsurface metagenome]
MNKIIDTRNLSNQVYDYILKSIIDGKLFFGQIVNIREIANELNISPMPVREAIKRLAFENIIQVNPRSNCVIKIPKKKNILELFEMRELIEVYALNKIFSDKKKVDFSKLHKLVEEMYLKKSEKNDSQINRELINLDTLYHTQIVSLAKNKSMLKIYKEITLQISMALNYCIVEFPYEEWVFRDHKIIYDHIINNSKKAILMLEEHFIHIKNNIEKSKKLSLDINH